MDDLERLVKSERKKLIASALVTKGVDKDAYDQLDRLSKLAADAKPQRRWLIEVLALFLLTVFIVLLVTEQRKTDIDMDMTVTELHFTVSRSVAITDDQFIRSLHASALDGIEVAGAYWPAPQGGTCTVDIELAGPAEKQDAITLPPLVVPKDWEVGLSRSGIKIDLELTGPPSSNKGDVLAATLALRGEARLSSDCTTDGIHPDSSWKGPSSLTLHLGSMTSIRYESKSDVSFARQIDFSNLRFYTDERYQIDAAPTDRRRSSVAGGTLFLDALNAKAVPLRHFEDLSFASSEGYIRSVSIPEDSKATKEELRVWGHATVRQMTLGSGTNKRSQMPNLLELLAAKNGIALLWASVVYVFAVIYAVLKWSGTTK
jgi:hypothetical protein